MSVRLEPEGSTNVVYSPLFAAERWCCTTQFYFILQIVSDMVLKDPEISLMIVSGHGVYSEVDTNCVCRM